MWRLRVLDWANPAAWRWRLTDDVGTFVADHAVRVDTAAWQFEAFTDLHRYLRWTAAPDRRLQHEAELVAELGDWVAQLLGPIGTALASRRGPVQVELPAEAAVVGYLPWELARVDGRTLAAHQVTFVIVAQPHQTLPKRAVGERLRLLAVFSLPEGVGALNLRKERVALSQLVQRIAKVNGKAIELRVLQYGATRERLEDALLEEPGWDVVHLSGHGLPAGLLLEDATGRHDLISSTDLVTLLDRGRDQIKLVTLSACESAAVTAVEHLRQLGLAPAVRDIDNAGGGGGSSGDAASPRQGPTLPALAAALVRDLDCAVLAMRYPVTDDFAIALAGSFYDLLLGRGQPVARALALSLTGRQVVPAEPTAGVPTLSVGTPVLFGSRAADLILAAPPGELILDTATQKMAEFPAQPPRFVGRVGPLTRAAAVLAPESGRSAVVLHGMAGAGKTACALELAYTHEQTFPQFMVWFKAPKEGADVRPALTAFALATERQVPGLEWAHFVDSAERLRDFLPRLTELLERNRILLVIDNAETLLTDDGQWRDTRWERVVTALAAHTGLSRLVLTTRTRPVGLPDTALVEPVHALSLPESVLLARELPRLRGLIDGTDRPMGMTAGAGQAIASRVLRAVQGHAKLLELADGAAADHVALTARLDEVDRFWLTRKTVVDAFVTTGATTESDADFGIVLAAWTRSTIAQLEPVALLLFQLICGMEEPDREPTVVSSVWPLMWEGGGRDRSAPDLATVLTALLDQALVTADCDPDGTATAWRVHPGVAAATNAATDPDLAVLIDDALAGAWMATLGDARRREAEQLGERLLRAARSAAPYLLRRHRWRDLNTVAHLILTRDNSVAAAAELKPLLEIATTTIRGTDQKALLARAHACTLLRLDPAHGIEILEDLLDTATRDGRYGRASVLAVDLINYLRDDGQYDRALTLAEQKIDFSRRAGYGPWTLLHDQSQKLGIQRSQGHVEAALRGVEQLRLQMAELPSALDAATEVVEIWNVRENILSEGAIAATFLGRWEQALALNAENLSSKRDRGASAHAQALDAFNNYFPLIKLGRLQEARELLIDCRAVYVDVDDIVGLGRSLGALSQVEHALGYLNRAIDLAQQALRFKYAIHDPYGIAVGHSNLASYLSEAATSPALVACHHLAGAIIAYQTGSGRLSASLIDLGRLLEAHPDVRPVSFTEVCRMVDQVPGVDLAALVVRLPIRCPDVDTTLHTVVDAAVRTFTRQSRERGREVGTSPVRPSRRRQP